MGISALDDLADHLIDHAALGISSVGIGTAFLVYRQTTEPSPNPGVPALWWKDRLAGTGDQFHINVKKSDDTWDFIPVLSAP